MEINPYLFLGIGRAKWIKYSINESFAGSGNLFTKGEKRISLQGATISIRSGWRNWLGLGDIEITSTNQEKLTWKKINNVKEVALALESGAKGKYLLSKKMKVIQARKYKTTGFGFEDIKKEAKVVESVKSEFGDTKSMTMELSLIKPII